MIICAIDPGVNNFAIAVEHVDIDLAKELDDVDKFYASETVFYTTAKLDSTDIGKSLISFLDSLEVLSKCDVILVERQMQFKNIINTNALYVSHCCLTYVSIKYPNIQCINYNASNKTKLMQCPDKLSKPLRKKWAVNTVNSILEQRGDLLCLEARRQCKSKIDDISDCTLMCLSFIILFCKGKYKSRVSNNIKHSEIICQFVRHL